MKPTDAVTLSKIVVDGSYNPPAKRRPFTLTLLVYHVSMKRQLTEVHQTCILSTIFASYLFIINYQQTLLKFYHKLLLFYLQFSPVSDHNRLIFPKAIATQTYLKTCLSKNSIFELEKLKTYSSSILEPRQLKITVKLFF